MSAYLHGCICANIYVMSLKHIHSLSNHNHGLGFIFKPQLSGRFKVNASRTYVHTSIRKPTNRYVSTYLHINTQMEKC